MDRGRDRRTDGGHLWYVPFVYIWCSCDLTLADEWLRSGVVLCKLINKIAPGSIRKINKVTSRDEP